MLFKLIIIYILGSLMGLYSLTAPNICRLDSMYVAMAEGDIKRITSQAELFYEHNGRYPSDLNQMVPDYLNFVPSDPWGRVYIYSLVSGKPYIKSLGKNGVQGGTGLSFDFASDTDWEKAINDI